LRAQVYPRHHALRARVHDGYAPIGIAFSAGERNVKFIAVGRERERAWLAAERLLAERPVLVAAFNDRVVGVDASARIRPPVNVARAEHNLGEAFEAATLSGRLLTNYVFDGVAILAGDYSASRISLYTCGEEAQVERGFRLGRQYPALERSGKRSALVLKTTIAAPIANASPTITYFILLIMFYLARKILFSSPAGPGRRAAAEAASFASSLNAESCC
jgi:hypothetical protein